MTIKDSIKVIFGGSFNPPTIAHYEICKAITKRFNVSDFVFMPTGISYGKKSLISSSHRYNMLEIMCSLIPNSRVSSFELEQEEYKGTYYTLEHFKGYYFILGADNLIEIKTWKNFPKVIEKNKFIVFNRNHTDLNNIFCDEDIAPYKSNFIVIDIMISDVSSTLYRKTLDETIVLPEIHNYVIENKLYEGSEKNE